MKILFVLEHLNTGGRERKASLLARGLAKRGHDVEVLTFYGGGVFEPEVRATNIPVHAVFDRWTEPRRTRLRLPGTRRARIWLSLWQRLRSGSYDVVYAIGPFPHIYVTTGALAMPTKVTWGLEGIFPSRPFRDRFERWVSRLSDLIIAVSEDTRGHYLRRGFPADRTIVIVNGVDLERFRIDPDMRETVRAELGLGDADRLIGTVSRLEPGKNIAGFLRAAALVADSGSRVGFLVVGSGQRTHVEYVKELARSLGIADRVIWIRWNTEVERYYNALDVFVSTSLSEGFPLTWIEAMACGVPCIVPNLSDAPRIVGHMGRVVAVGDHNATAEAIRDVMATDLLADRESVRRWVVERFSAERQVERTEAALLQLFHPACVKSRQS